MHVSLVISGVLHAALLGFALFSLSAPESLDVADVEAVPVSIIPFEEITQLEEGDIEATASEIAAPIPTIRQNPVEDAQTTGDNTVDLSNKAPTPNVREVVSDAPPKSEPAPKPEKPEPVVRPEPTPQIAPQQDTAPATEVAALPQPSQPVTPDPIADAISEAEALPEQVEPAPRSTTIPIPTIRPAPAPAQTAKTPERKITPPTETAKAATKPVPQASESDFNSDEIAALLNREEAQGGGAKRSQEPSSLGARINTAGKLSQSELDALRGQIQQFWNIIPGSADGGDIVITVAMQLDRSGNLVGEPKVDARGGSDQLRQTLARSARRAVLRAQPYNLPADKFETWSEVVVNFRPDEF